MDTAKASLRALAEHQLSSRAVFTVQGNQQARLQPVSPTATRSLFWLSKAAFRGPAEPF